MKLDYQIAIIGAGFSGIVAALRLKTAQQNDFVIFERAAEVGGTWRDNVYPGCACDIPSHLYSISTEANPDWSENYASQAEIWAYMKSVAEKRDLLPHIRFQTEIKKLVFMEKEGYWQITDAKGNATKVKMVIWATGTMNRPNIPNFDGMETFKGKIMHTFAWDKEFDLNGKKIAVIGTGASAIQVIPEMAKIAQKLTVFQRTPAWIVMRNNKKVNDLRKFLYKNIPFFRYLYRERIYWFCEMGGLGFIGYEWANLAMKWIGQMKLKMEVKNPEIRQKLTPTYKMGCKRVMLTDDYLPTFNRENVHLETDGIAKMTSNGILTQNGNLHELDAIIMATGFEAADFRIPVEIVGRNGKNLREYWAENGAQALVGTTVSGFPNFAIMLGPNTGLGHNSMIHIMESQMNYVMEYWNLLKQQTPLAFLDATKSAQDTYNQQITQNFKGTVWTSGCNSWYMNEAQKPTILYPGLTVKFRKVSARIQKSDYEIVENTL